MDINNLAVRLRQNLASSSSVLTLYDTELIVLNDRNARAATTMANAILGHATATTTAAITSILSAPLAILFHDIPL